MPESVVDLFEVVDVDEYQDERPIADRFVEPLRQQESVGQVGQRVVMGLVRESALGIDELFGQHSLYPHRHQVAGSDKQRQRQIGRREEHVDSPPPDDHLEREERRAAHESDVGKGQLGQLVGNSFCGRGGRGGGSSSRLHAISSGATMNPAPIHRSRLDMSTLRR